MYTVTLAGGVWKMGKARRGINDPQRHSACAIRGVRLLHAQPISVTI